MINFIIAVLATTQVYRLELDTDTNIPTIVGQDGVRRQVCIVDPDEYAMMTGRVDQVWRSLNSSEDGRRKLHGSRKETAVEGAEKRTVYADGYVHREKMEIRKSETIEKFIGNGKKVKAKRVYSNMSDRQKAFLEKRDEVLSKPVKEITVEHNAATGKDIVK